MAKASKPSARKTAVVDATGQETPSGAVLKGFEMLRASAGRFFIPILLAVTFLAATYMFRQQSREEIEQLNASLNSTLEQISQVTDRHISTAQKMVKLQSDVVDSTMKRREELKKINSEMEMARLELANAKATVAQEKAVADKAKADAEAARAAAQQAEARAITAKAEAEKARADAEKAKAEAEKAKADASKAQAEAREAQEELDRKFQESDPPPPPPEPDPLPPPPPLTVAELASIDNAIHVIQSATAVAAPKGREHEKRNWRLITFEVQVDQAAATIRDGRELIDKVIYVLDEEWYSDPVKIISNRANRFRYSLRVWGPTQVTVKIHLSYSDEVVCRQRHFNLNETTPAEYPRVPCPS